MLYIGDNFFEKICIRFSFFSFFRSPKKKKNYCCSSVHRNMFSTHLTRIFRCIVIKLKFLRIVRLDFIRFTVWLIIKRNIIRYEKSEQCYEIVIKILIRIIFFFSIKVFISNWLLRDFNFYESSVSLSFFLLFLLRLLLCIHLNICNLIVNFVFLFKIVNIFFFISDQFYIFHFHF